MTKIAHYNPHEIIFTLSILKNRLNFNFLKTILDFLKAIKISKEFPLIAHIKSGFVMR